MSDVNHLPEFPLARRGLWILFGVVAFQVGYPIVLMATFGRHNRVTALAITFFVLGLLAIMGFRIPRYLSAAASAVVACILGFTLLQLGPLVPDDLGERWSIVLMLPVIPMIGLAICARMLLTQSVANWQQLLWDQRLDAQFAQRQEVLADRQAYAGMTERCPWCDENVVRPTDDQCRSCQRPV